MMENSLPICNFCEGKTISDHKQSEWTLDYNYINGFPKYYGFCCTDCISKLINSISNGKRGELKLGLLTKWNYDKK